MIQFIITKESACVSICCRNGETTRRQWAKLIGAQVAKYYNKTVNPRKFRIGDWVLRKLKVMTRDSAKGKFNAKWERPYRVVKCHNEGAYRLESREGKSIPRAWNVEHLKKYYM
jgi:hypothetical protein